MTKPNLETIADDCAMERKPAPWSKEFVGHVVVGNGPWNWKWKAVGNPDETTTPERGGAGE